MNRVRRPSRRPSRRKLFAAAAALLLAPLGGACAGFVQQLHVVSISDEKGFQPADLSIHAGDTVRWKNYGFHAHSVADDPSASSGSAGVASQSLPQGAQPLNSGDILPGRTWSYTFTIPGRYQYVSTDDQGQQFQGTITVG